MTALAEPPTAREHRALNHDRTSASLDAAVRPSLTARLVGLIERDAPVGRRGRPEARYRCRIGGDAGAAVRDRA